MLSNQSDGPGTQFAFPLIAPPAGTGPLSIFIELDTPASMRPQWDNGHTASDIESSVHSQSSLIWKCGLVHAEHPFGRTEPMQALTMLADGTWGLRRSGVIQFKGIDFSSTRHQTPNAKLWLVFELQDRSSRRAFLPRVRQILPNAVLARHVYRYKLVDQSSAASYCWRKRFKYSPTDRSVASATGQPIVFAVREGEYPIHQA